MKLAGVEVPDSYLVYGGGALLAVGVLYYVGRNAGELARGVSNAVINDNPALDVNQGTPYKGFGVLGTLGNITNRVLGGVPQAIGESRAVGAVFDWVGGVFDGPLETPR